MGAVNNDLRFKCKEIPLITNNFLVIYYNIYIGSDLARLLVFQTMKLTLTLYASPSTHHIHQLDRLVAHPLSMTTFQKHRSIGHSLVGLFSRESLPNILKPTIYSVVRDLSNE